MFEPLGAEAVPRDRRSPLVRWGLGTALLALALAFAIYIAGSTVLVLVAPSVYDRDSVVFSILGYQFLGLGVAAAVYWLIVGRAGADLEALGFRNPGVSILLRALLSLVPIFVGVALISAAFSAFLPGYHLQGNANQELPVGHHVNTIRAVVILLWAAVEAPLVEETLFRGIIFQGITQLLLRWLNRDVAVFGGAVASGFLFGLAHFEPRTLPILVFLGIALAYVFYYGRSVFASALVHGTVNAIAALSVFHGS